MTVARTLVACGFMVIAGGLTYSAATTGNVGAGWGAFLAGLAALACVLLTGDPR